MEHPELFKERQPRIEINFEDLKGDIDAIDLDFEAGFDEVEYQDHLYLIQYVDDETIDGPAEWRVSESGHYDIEIEVRQSLSDIEIRRAILHEVIEADLSQYQKMTKDKAHHEASKFDKQYENRGLPRENGA